MEICASANQILIDNEKSNADPVSKLVTKISGYLQMASGLVQIFTFLPVLINIKIKLDRKLISNSLKFLYLYYFLNNY